MAKTYPDIGTFSSGDILTATTMNQIGDNLDNQRVPPMVRCTTAGGQVIPSGGAAPTLLQWAGTDAFDTDAMHDTAVNNTRITANTAGVFVVVGSVFLDGQTANRIQLEIVRYTSGGSASPIETQEGSVSFGLQVTALVNLAVGEYVTLGLFHATGGNRTIGARSFFSAAWLGQAS